jgi:probable rRNA maturation factor
LHLQGFDHEKKRDALKMERLEVEILAKLGFNDPYESEQS